MTHHHFSNISIDWYWSLSFFYSYSHTHLPVVSHCFRKYNNNNRNGNTTAVTQLNFILWFSCKSIIFISFIFFFFCFVLFCFGKVAAVAAALNYFDAIVFLLCYYSTFVIRIVNIRWIFLSFAFEFLFYCKSIEIRINFCAFGSDRLIN